MTKKLSEELKNAIVDDYLNGLPTKEIRKKYKTYELYAILNQRGIEPKQNKTKKQEKYNKVVELYLTGISISEIKEIAGCSDVYAILNRLNIKTNRRHSEELKNAIVDDYLNGVTVREIKKKYKTYQLYRILKERGIEYKQDNAAQKEKYKLVIDLYLMGERIDTIIERTKYKDVYKILNKFNIKKERDPKQYNTTKKEERNRNVIKDYLSGDFSIETLIEKYQMSATNIYRILKVYDIPRKWRKTHHWVIHKKARECPNERCKFYILQDYYGYTKIGITTRDQVRDRFRKNVKIFYELDDKLGICYDLEIEMKRILKKYHPKKIDRTIDGWSECYDLTPQEILEMTLQQLPQNKHINNPIL